MSERDEKTMVEISRGEKENRFFKWLSINIPNQAIEIKRNYKSVEMILLQKHAILTPIVDILDPAIIDRCLSDVHHLFSGKKARKNAVIMMNAYRTMLEELLQSKKEDKPKDLKPSRCGLQEHNATESITELMNNTRDHQDCEHWIKYDFTNSKSFEGTRPVFCEINGYSIEGETWTRVFVSIIERELEKDNPNLETLYSKALTLKRQKWPFFLKEKLDNLYCVQLSTGYWIYANWNTPQMIDMIGHFLIHCGYDAKNVSIYGIPKQIQEMTEQKKNVERAGEMVPEVLMKAIPKYYPGGIRFDATVLGLLEEYSGCAITEIINNNLQSIMFHRRDGLCFLTSMLDGKRSSIIERRAELITLLKKYSCIEMSTLFNLYVKSSSITIIRNVEDFEDYLLFIAKEDIRIATALNTKIIRLTGVTVNEALQQASNYIVALIKENGCMTQEEILDAFPVFSEQFLKKLFAKCTDEIVLTEINDYLCYQSIEELGLDDTFSDTLDEVLGDITTLSLDPSLEILHALLSVKMGYNLREELGIPDDKTFRHIISMYYTGKTKRLWKVGRFSEAG